MTTFDAVAAALPAYEIGGEIGRGGMGLVLSGRHRQLQRQVAIKQLPPSFAADPSVRDRFTTEARLLASLDHPHVVPVYDFVEQDGLCVLVMELLPGGTVWSRFTSDGFSPPSAAAVALACAAGLKAAHDRGILHRDVKPENLMFGATGALKVTDFGIAKMIGGGETLATRAGEIVGTPAYIAPEQARGGALSPATDVYALATMLYELLAGVLPFTHDGDAMMMLFRHAFEAPTPLDQVAPGVPPSVVSVVMRGLATDPAERFPTAEAFGMALASACRTYWGPSWLYTQGIPVLGADTMTAAAAAPAAAPSTVQGWSPTPVAPPPMSAPVRPSITMHARGVALGEVSASDLVPVQKVVLPRARVPALIAAVLAVGAIAVAFVGVGSPARGGDLAGNTIVVAGQSATAGGRVPLDLTKPVSVSLTGAAATDQARLSLEVLGVSVKAASAPVRQAAGSDVATLPAIGDHYLLGGRFTARLVLLDQGRTVGTWRFGARTTQSSYATAIAAVDALLLLFAAAYVESLMRAMRRYRSRVSGRVGLPVVSAILALGVVAAAWVALGREPTPAGVASCVVLAALAGGFAGVSALRVGRRRRRRSSRHGQA